MGRYSLRDKLILAAIVALFVWYYLLRGQTFGPELFTTFESYLFLGVALILAVTFHEFSHATVALLLGDRTAQMLGRVSLNPIRHLDLYGTLAFVFFHFGWGKPTPINPYNMKGVPPLVGAAITAIAGPISNVVFAFLPRSRFGSTCWLVARTSYCSSSNCSRQHPAGGVQLPANPAAGWLQPGEIGAAAQYQRLPRTVRLHDSHRADLRATIPGAAV